LDCALIVQPGRARVPSGFLVLPRAADDRQLVVQLLHADLAGKLESIAVVQGQGGTSITIQAALPLLASSRDRRREELWHIHQLRTESAVRPRNAAGGRWSQTPLEVA
jgi:hypothetical protein